ncbi:hypothetical protein L7F22_044356 [Adiantum nelumboides]|nr:hypothetical protein [Adiantum nelumboides]
MLQMWQIWTLCSTVCPEQQCPEPDKPAVIEVKQPELGPVRAITRSFDVVIEELLVDEPMSSKLNPKAKEWKQHKSTWKEKGKAKESDEWKEQREMAAKIIENLSKKKLEIPECSKARAVQRIPVPVAEALLLETKTVGTGSILVDSSKDNSDSEKENDIMINYFELMPGPPALLYAMLMEETELPRFYPALYPPHTEPADQMKYMQIVEQIKEWWEKFEGLWKEWTAVINAVEEKKVVKEFRVAVGEFKVGMRFWKRYMHVLVKHTNALLQLNIATSKIPKKDIKNLASNEDTYREIGEILFEARIKANQLEPAGWLAIVISWQGLGLPRGEKPCTAQIQKSGCQ